MQNHEDKHAKREPAAECFSSEEQEFQVVHLNAHRDHPEEIEEMADVIEDSGHISEADEEMRQFEPEDEESHEIEEGFQVNSSVLPTRDDELVIHLVH